MASSLKRFLFALTGLSAIAGSAAAQEPRLARLKTEAANAVEQRGALTQQIVDMLFSFGELAFQEVETSRYLTGILERNGFAVRRGVGGMPTAWVATWGSGKPVIALGSDIDAIPGASQRPGVAFRAPLVEGAPGHGEGHNSGQAVNVTAALVLKDIMQRERIPGTIVLWPGVAEELLAGKPFLVRDGVFRDVDAVIFTHVDSEMGTSWGDNTQNALISAVFSFEGVAAHAAGSAHRGRSALDAVELMNAGWNYRREHLRPQQRSHYVITDGGAQPNVVPNRASVWYFVRETNAPRTRELFDIAHEIARGAAMMTGTTFSGSRILGSAWAPHFNRPLAEALDANIRAAGMPRWSDADQTLARAVQREIGVDTIGLATEVDPIDPTVPESRRLGGSSDDIGDVSWVVPTVVLRYPSNIPRTPGHHWADAIAMATPIAHKGATAGAKVVAMTMLDLLLTPALVEQTRRYFTEVQTRNARYEPLIGPSDLPAIELNAETMARFRPEMRRLYYDPARHRTYLEQLGIRYPTVRADTTRR